MTGQQLLPIHSKIMWFGTHYCVNMQLGIVVQHYIQLTSKVFLYLMQNSFSYLHKIQNHTQVVT